MIRFQGDSQVLEKIYNTAPNTVRIALAFLCVIPFWWLFSFPSVKRLHDLNFPGWYFPLVMLIPIYAYCERYIFIIFKSITFRTNKLLFLEIAGLLICLLLAIKKGTKGTNRYGPDPLERGISPN